MKQIGVWALGLGLVMAGASCADQTSGDGNTTASAPAGTLLDEVKLNPGSRIEGQVAQVDILSDDTTKVPAPLADSHLLNPWGLAFFPNGPAWIAANGNSTLDVFDGDGTRLREVMIPGTTRAAIRPRRAVRCSIPTRTPSGATPSSRSRRTAR